MRLVVVFFASVFTFMLIAVATAAQSDSVYTIVQQMPEFKGGQTAFTKFMNEELKQPSVIQQYKVRAKVYIRFVVSGEGLIEKPEIVRCSYVLPKGHELPEQEVETMIPLLEQESMRVLKAMPPWNPGKHQGHTVPVWTNITFQFSPKN